MARSLVENLSAKFRPEEYSDRYRMALQELIERKMRGDARNARRRKPEPKVVDLMAALEASLRDAKADRERPAGRPAAERAPAGSRAAKASKRDQEKPAERRARTKPATRARKSAA